MGLTATHEVPKPTSLEQPRTDHAAFPARQQGPKDVLAMLGRGLVERRAAGSPGGHGAAVQAAGMLLGVEVLVEG